MELNNEFRSYKVMSEYRFDFEDLSALTLIATKMEDGIS
jgi:hypothetical protein